MAEELALHLLYIIDWYEVFGKPTAYTKSSLRHESFTQRIYTGTYQECCAMAVRVIENGWIDLKDNYTQIERRHYITK